ncbi:SDR family oxidoreductase [Thermosipho atlanticus]|uniref:NAD(P)-dependent dehydrogenase, short-chain alcohol dehydrogenase family n=1 Tax=Thermosipho atlanticus DSM 15807 TaxID=1123380 RepID=A0A1M5T083_9BACT|nr:SDR family oxidoreductase [Thermosipho atlanticus]SHH44159.1 NAD(P)-dependent dehydrogenase, short-chain alcohol dehydrogenase family [Thermosipho atlanticus DSM 15807]
MTFLITGANRGIGFALTKEILKKKHKVIAAVRNLKAKNLLQLEEENIDIMHLDISDYNSIVDFSAQLKCEVDILINNAGVLFKDSFPELKYEDFLNSFKVNTLGALFLTQELYKNKKLKKGGKIVNIDSILGSISNTRTTPSYCYSISKAALNMATKLLSNYFLKEDILVFSVHPGWVKTDMGGKNAPITPEESAKNIINLIENVKETGKFYDYTGKEIEW